MRSIAVVIMLFSIACSGKVKQQGEDLPVGKVRLYVGDEVINGNNLDAVLAPALWWVNTHGSPELYAVERTRLSKELVMLRAMTTYMDDATREGHYVFFKSTPPAVTEDAIEGFKAAGLEPFAVILGTASTRSKGHALEDVDFEDDDVKLLELAEKADPYHQIWQFIRSNRSRFYYDELVNKPH